MTREEAKKRIIALKITLNLPKDCVEAFDMAIEALSAEPSSDLISREKTIESMELESAKEGAYGYIDIKSAVEMIEALPSIEAVKVVRCKDCRYKEYDITHNFCDLNYHKCYDDDFCSWGERIVRCGECKYLQEDGRCDCFADSSIRPSASDFCSYGERKGDDSE